MLGSSLYCSGVIHHVIISSKVVISYLRTCLSKTLWVNLTMHACFPFSESLCPNLFWDIKLLVCEEHTTVIEVLAFCVTLLFQDGKCYFILQGFESR